jgi:phosphatidylglycerol:prolipoprotein diacylglycerol transferase
MILTQPSIDPVIFSFGFLEIRWYGLAYIAAFLISVYLIKYFNNKLKSSFKNKLIDDFFIWSILGVIIGGRIGYVLIYQLDSFLFNPIYIIYIWKGGMSFHGGLIGIIISIFLFSKKNNIQFFSLADLISLVAPIGLFFGRIANFINVELIGRVTDFPFAIIYPTIDNLPRHPSQLYEAFLEGIILFIILLIIFFKSYSIDKYGQLSGFFLFFYGIFRFSIEFLREPDQHIGLFLNFLSMGQLLSIPLIFIGIIILWKKKSYV